MKTLTAALFLLAVPVRAADLAANWLKTYTLAPYKQIWSTQIVVRSLAGDLPKIQQALEKNGGKATQAMAAFAGGAHNQQMTYQISKAGAAKALKAMMKLGKTGAPRVNLPPEVVPLEEVRAKLAALTTAQTQHASQLADMPAVNELIEELVARLRTVESVQTRTDSEVLWNLSIEEKR